MTCNKYCRPEYDEHSEECIKSPKIEIKTDFDEEGFYIAVNGIKFRKATKAGQYIVNTFGLTPTEAMHLALKDF